MVIYNNIRGRSLGLAWGGAPLGLRYRCVEVPLGCVRILSGLHGGSLGVAWAFSRGSVELNIRLWHAPKIILLQ